MDDEKDLPSVTLRDMKFKSEKARDIFLAELMMFLEERLEEYECEHHHLT